GQTVTFHLPLQPRNIMEPSHELDELESLPDHTPAPAVDTSISRRTYLRLISAGFAFFVAGVNDGSLGALMPYILNTYHIGTNVVTAVYGTTFVGWLVAALTNTLLSQYLDLGAMLILGVCFQILAHALRSWQPPFPLFVVTFFFASLGQAYQDTHANTFVASVHGAHRWLGFIHAMYMAGCLVAPFMATAVASASSSTRWALFYTAPLSLGCVNLMLASIAFYELVRARKGRQNAVPATSNTSRSQTALSEIRRILLNPAVWLLSLFFFFFLGAGITAGGWVVEYLVRVRKGDVVDMGYVPAGFYGGGFLGRLLLAEPTYRFGERRMIFIYVVLFLSELCGYLAQLMNSVPNIITEAVAISLLGLFSGPFFATGISVGSKIFPPDIRSSALGVKAQYYSTA
ncbi:MFS transporter, partial [Penicillium lagena]|uniref:MFS transporter n=1 Tax=Penicillium lagena TaxID=94218 RepID=UPI0025419A49